ncbi:MAG TPA: hypothetical protein VMS38_20115 [Pseudorhodoferax sp.]|nr:hypothetical protein [Pseudorhodoferax sp.]
MTIEQKVSPGSGLWPSGTAAQVEPAESVEEQALLYRGVDIRIAVQRTPDYVFGRADLVDGQRYLGRLSIGNPSATPEEIQQRLAALAQARVDIARAFRVGGDAGMT